MKKKVLLYEDNEELRISLSSLIGFSNDLELCGAFENCADVLQHVESFEPDIILMDIDMPDVDGLEGLRRVRSQNENIPIIMLTVFDDSQNILDAIKRGATGYVLKQHLTTRLGNAIQEALEGGSPMSPVVARLVLKHISNQNDKKNTYSLTPREKEILQSLTDGNSYKMIADQKEISIGTVTTHIKNIYEKLGVHSQSEAVSKTLREGLV